MCEKRFYLSNSNSKWISIGVNPTTPILDEAASGFEVDVYLGGEKGSISLGGVAGAAALFDSFRKLPQFAPMYTQQKFNFKGALSANIVVTKANFGTEVKDIIFIFILFHFKKPFIFTSFTGLQSCKHIGH